MSADVGDPVRDPRPQNDDGEYLCYHEGCSRTADVAVPRGIESTRIDPVETAVTSCFKCWLAWGVLSDTRSPLDSTLRVHESVHEDTDEESWVTLRAKARSLANMVLFDDPLGSDSPGDDSPLSDDWENAGLVGDRLREKLDTPVEQQLSEYDYPDIAGNDEDPTSHQQETDLTDFSSN